MSDSIHTPARTPSAPARRSAPIFLVSLNSGRPGHSVLTEPIGSVPRFLHKFGSSKLGTDRFFLEVGTETIRFRLIRFGSGYNRTNRISSPPFASSALCSDGRRRSSGWPPPRTHRSSGWLPPRAGLRVAAATLTSWGRGRE